jgi:hypothetical protein
MHHIQDPKQDLIMLEEPPQHQGRGEKQTGVVDDK